MDRQDEIPCVFQIPLQHESGREVAPEEMVLFLGELARRFHGYTPLGTILGGNWHGQVESSDRIEVWVTRERVPELAEVVKWIGRQLGQKEMFLIVPEASVHRYDLQQPDTEDRAANQ